MKNRELDRRTQKTNQAIHEALMSLMSKKHYDEITIQNIIDKANIGRSTFYSHYATKDELLFESIEPMLEMVNNCIIKYIECGGMYSEIATVSALFEHLKENSHMLKRLIKAESSTLFFDRIALRCNKQIEKYLSTKLASGLTSQIPLSLLTHHISTTMVGLIKWWSNNDMTYSPTEMNQFFHELISPCLNSHQAGL